MNEVKFGLMDQCLEAAKKILGKHSLSETAPLMGDITRLALILFADATQPESCELIEVVEVEGKQAWSEEDPILAALQSAFEKRDMVTVTFSGTTEEGEYTGYITSLNCGKLLDGLERVISFGDKGKVGPTMYLSAVTDVLIKVSRT